MQPHQRSPASGRRNSILPLSSWARSRMAIIPKPRDCRLALRLQADTAIFHLQLEQLTRKTHPDPCRNRPRMPRQIIERLLQNPVHVNRHVVAQLVFSSRLTPDFSSATCMPVCFSNTERYQSMASSRPPSSRMDGCSVWVRLRVFSRASCAMVRISSRSAGRVPAGNAAAAPGSAWRPQR